MRPRRGSRSWGPHDHLFVKEPNGMPEAARDQTGNRALERPDEVTDLRAKMETLRAAAGDALRAAETEEPA